MLERNLKCFVGLRERDEGDAVHQPITAAKTNEIGRKEFPEIGKLEMRRRRVATLPASFLFVRCKENEEEKKVRIGEGEDRKLMMSM